MAILLAGATGLLGTALTTTLVDLGTPVRVLVRPNSGPTPAGATRVLWQPEGPLPPDALTDVSAVVNLGGTPISQRWTRARAAAMLSSRVVGTGTLARAIAGTPVRLLQANAIGWYGDGGEEQLTEASPSGDTPLASLSRRWAAAAAPAGPEVTYLRTGIVLSRDGGALGPLVPLVKAGLAGPMGGGRQWWSWIHVRDWVGAVIHLLEHPVAGPVNLTAPEPERNRDLVSSLAQALHRPAVLPAPGFALRAALGGFGAELLRSQRVLPTALLRSGYEFTFPSLPDAVDDLFG